MSGRVEAEGMENGQCSQLRRGGGLGCGDKPSSFMLALIALGMQDRGVASLREPRVTSKSF